MLAIKGSGSNSTNLCYERYRAEKITYTCTNQYIPYDGEFMKSLVIIDGVDRVQTVESDANGCTDEIRGMKVDEATTDFTCQWRPAPRRHTAYATIGKRVFVSGGYTNRSTVGSDLWYRGTVSFCVACVESVDAGCLHLCRGSVGLANDRCEAESFIHDRL
jgi:hypothetical protein